jgi:multisubunit Na+/H+ antiporter MnhE subunit
MSERKASLVQEAFAVLCWYAAFALCLPYWMIGDINLALILTTLVTGAVVAILTRKAIRKCNQWRKEKCAYKSHPTPTTG